MRIGFQRISTVGIGKKVQLILTIRCEEASQLVSDSFERKLNWHEKLALKGHALVCWSCRQFSRQLQFIRSAMSKRSDQELEDLSCGPSMPQSTKDRLKSLHTEEPE